MLTLKPASRCPEHTNLKIQDTMVSFMNHDEMNTKMAQVIEKSNEWGSKIPIGIFYQNEHIPTYQERIVARIPNYMESPPAKQSISDQNDKPTAKLNKLLDDLRADK